MSGPRVGQDVGRPDRVDGNGAARTGHDIGADNGSAPAPSVGRTGRWRRGVRRYGRAVPVSLVLALLTAFVFCWSLAVGDYPLSIAEVVRTLIGQGDSGADLVVHNLRMPRSLVGLYVGLGFGLSGAIFQRLTGNPLASPDIIGVTMGSAVGAVYVLVFWQAMRFEVTVAAIGGGIATTMAIYLLAYRRGVTGYRLVLVGIGISEMLRATVHYMLTKADLMDARRATVWLTGSLNGRSWDHVRPLTVALLVLVPFALILARQLRLLELGDDMARGLGARVERARSALLMSGVGLAAVCTAAAGPVGFVALVAPQIARRLAGNRTVGLVPAALCGGLLVVASDLVARRILAPTELPVGIVTAILGAPYLLWLLARSNR